MLRGRWYGIYAVTVERVNANYGYVVTTDNEDFDCAEDTPVYHLYNTSRATKLTTEDDNEDTLTLQAGSSYILYTENGEVVFALLVESGADIAAPLFTAISGKTLEMPTATVTIHSSVDVLVNGVAYTAPVEAKIGDVLTLEFAAPVVVSTSGANCTMGATLQSWTVTVTENTVEITAAQ